ncbi:MAG: GDP-mannose 4,6-dehydratase [candidate division KSB1 bacterium]|nr:GDP-mannose 4,6-dehydratase [candidate division KSB1 bacterium]MDQ7063018.1 GDP-mannose 4,6-dehydratase [candidate division KSB1 bacterium]
MKVLVTGGAGFIGSHFCEYLLDREHKVVALDNFNDYYDPEIKRRNVESFARRKDAELVEGDILDAELLERLFAQHHFDAVVHLAARAGVRPSLRQPKLYERVNVQGTIEILEQAQKHGVKKIVVASSSSVYGNNKKVPFSESDPVDHPISPYAATKKACELIAYTYHHLYDLDITCLRFFTVYGPRQRPDMAIHKFTALIARGEPIPMYGDGSTQRDYTYITDILDGVYKSLLHCEGYHIYNLGESRTIRLRDLIQLIEEAYGKKAEIRQLPMQPGDVQTTYADISRAKLELGYDPQVDVADGVREFVKWFKATYVCSQV